MNAYRFLFSTAITFLFILGIVGTQQVSALPSSLIEVNTLADELNDDGDCSLREAVNAANDNIAYDACPAGQSSSLDQITFSVSGMIVLSEQLSVTGGGPLSIDGGGSITISGNSSVRIFSVEIGADLTLQSLDLVDGLAFEDSGGGILNAGTLSITSCTFTGNEAQFGGAVFNETNGNLSISNSDFSVNSATTHAASIYNYDEAILNVDRTSFTENFISEVILNRGEATITESTFSSNAEGAIWNSYTGTITISNSDFTSNRSWYSPCLLNNNIASISQSTFSSNYASVDYGCINNNAAMMTIDDSTFYDNSTAGVAGAVGSYLGELTITDSTFDGNRAHSGGGIRINSTPAVISNSTFSNNSGSYGAGLGNFRGSVNVNYSTFVGNTGNSGGIYNDSGTLTISNSILKAGSSGSNCYGTISDGGHNIDSQNTCAFDTSIGSMINTDPLVGPLEDNGGLTFTHALLDGSPAIDAADAGLCPETDQRSIPRPLDGDGNGSARCDIGSYELEQTTSTIITSDGPDPSEMYETFTVSFTVSTSHGVPSGLVTVTVGGSSENCSDVLVGGSGSCQITLNTPGAYTLTATYAGGNGLLSSNDTENHSVTKLNTNTIISSDLPDPSLIGQPFTVDFSVVASHGVPSGSINITVSGSAESCSDQLVGGSGSCQITLNTPGEYTLTASYPGSGNFLPSNDIETHTVNKFATSTFISDDSPDPSQAGQPFTVVFHVTSTHGIPSGSVNITVNGSSESCSGQLMGEIGSCQITLNTPGAHTLTAIYTGNDEYLPSSDIELHGVEFDGELIYIYLPLNIRD